MAYINATGRRKTSIARVFMKQGSGVITINGRTLEDYFPGGVRQYIVNQSTETAGVVEQYDFKVNVSGGGLTGQAEAIRLGIARAIVKASEGELKPALKTKGLLTRDPRMVERKKYGHKKARKSFQFSKR